MSKLLGMAAKGVGFALATIGLATLWFRLWLYEGLPVAPRFLRYFYETDGEGSYDQVLYGIMILSALANAVIFHLIPLLLKRERCKFVQAGRRR